MADSKYIPKTSVSDTVYLRNEQQLLLKHYDFLKVKIQGKSLTCRGSCKPTDLSIKYEYLIKLGSNRIPVAFAIYPKIAYDENIHMYPKDNSLCLYYPKDFSWNSASHLYNTIVPWTHEWFLFYELYQITGKWLHPGIKHN